MDKERIRCKYPMSKFHNFEDEVLKGEKVSTLEDCEDCAKDCGKLHCLIADPLTITHP